MPPPIRKKADPIQTALELSQKQAKQRRDRGITPDTQYAEMKFRERGADSGYDIEKPIPLGSAGQAPAPMDDYNRDSQTVRTIDALKPRKRKLTVSLR